MSSEREQDNKEASSNNSALIALGAGVGLAIGAGLGIALGELVMGAGAGMVLGAGIGTAIMSHRNAKNK